MNRNEFQTWWRDFSAKFPSVGGWLAKLPDNSRDEQFAIWFSALEKTPLQDAMEVNHLMAIGELDAVGSYDSDREKTGAIVRSECDALRRARQPERQEHWQRDRLKCRTCQDTGFVEVYRPKFLAFCVRLIDQGISLVKYREAGWKGRISQTVICSCEAGEEKIFHGKAEQLPKGLSKARLPDVQRYHSDKFHRVIVTPIPNVDRDTPAEKVCAAAVQRDATDWQAAAEWFSGRRDQWSGAVVYDEFEAWNSGEWESPTVEFRRP